MLSFKSLFIGVGIHHLFKFAEIKLIILIFIEFLHNFRPLFFVFGIFATQNEGYLILGYLAVTVDVEHLERSI